MADDRKVYIKTYGCQMNVYDSERMQESLQAEGYASTETPDDADLILLNTCHIREKASEKVYSELGRYKHLKEQHPDLKLGVAGCVAQAEGEEIMRRQPLVDLVVGPQSYHRLGAMVGATRDGQKVLDIDFPEEDKFAHLGARKRSGIGPTAFLTVQEGCDKFCAFCVVPYTRGAEVSRSAQDVLNEARSLVSQGVREVTLLGQNVNAYHGAGLDGRDWSLARLIYAMAEIDGLARIRYTTSHPNDMTDDLIAAHKECPSLMPYLHLPVQSGSDFILKRMNRNHTAASYLKVIDKIKVARPDILISGDFIVGFPEESDEDFAQTMELVRRVEYGQCYSFKYSTRPGTPAAERAQVPEDVKIGRLSELQALLHEQQVERQKMMIGQTVSVLFEKSGREPGQMVGKSDHLHAVFTNAPDLEIGALRQVRITGTAANSLSGDIMG